MCLLQASVLWLWHATSENSPKCLEQYKCTGSIAYINMGNLITEVHYLPCLELEISKNKTEQTNMLDLLNFIEKKKNMFKIFIRLDPILSTVQILLEKKTRSLSNNFLESHRFYFLTSHSLLVIQGNQLKNNTSLQKNTNMLPQYFFL